MVGSQMGFYLRRAVDGTWRGVIAGVENHRIGQPPAGRRGPVWWVQVMNTLRDGLDRPDNHFV